MVKTSGDAVMATFPTPDRALAAALRIREAMRTLNNGRSGNELRLKIGIHEGPCLAVVLNNRQDYFGRTVNIAARVQGSPIRASILATGSVVNHPRASTLLATSGLHPVPQHRALRGIAEELAVYRFPDWSAAGEACRRRSAPGSAGYHRLLIDRRITPMLLVGPG